MWRRLGSLWVNFFLPLTQRGDGNGSFTHKDIFSLQHSRAARSDSWKIAKSSCAHVFVVLIAKYVAIYALFYIMPAMYLCCLEKNTIQDFDSATACVVEGKPMLRSTFCVCGDDSQWWWFRKAYFVVNVSQHQFHPCRRRRWSHMCWDFPHMLRWSIFLKLIPLFSLA